MDLIKTEDWNSQENSKNPIPYFKVDPIVVLLLGIVTCEVLNAVSGKEIISSPIAVFAGCCYPVNVYFFYLAGKDALPDVYKRTNSPMKDDSILLLILGFFLPMVAAMIVQGDINKLYES